MGKFDICAEPGGGIAMSTLKRFCGWTLHLIGCGVCFYVAVGWLTIYDIRNECRKRNIDEELTLNALLGQPTEYAAVKSSDGSISMTQIIHPDNAFLSRLRARYVFSSASVNIQETAPTGDSDSAQTPNELSNTDDTGSRTNEVHLRTKFDDDGTRRNEMTFPPNSSGRHRQASLQSSELQPLLPFLVISPNALNLIFCFCLGYLISLAMVCVRTVQTNLTDWTTSLRRAIAGGLSSAVLFLVVLSGGTLLWNTGNLREMSVGAVACIGGIFYERLEAVLTKAVSNRKLKNEVD